MFGEAHVQPEPARPLQGRVAVVTGASSGIGLAIARLFMDNGARVHGIARRVKPMTDGVGSAGESRSFTAHGVDVTDPSGVERVVQQIGEQGALDILICAAGTNIPNRRLDQLTTESWNDVVSVNLNGVFSFVRAALPHLRNSQGCIVLVSSVSASWPDASGAAYQASKSGVLALARATALEEHRNGVRCSAILPGLVDTPILEKRPSPPDPLVREQSLRPEDVAAACLFLVTLPPRAYVPELTILPTQLQALGDT